MAFRFVTIATAVLHIAAAFPAITLEDFQGADDMMSVGSYVRETRAAPVSFPNPVLIEAIAPNSWDNLIQFILHDSKYLT